MSYLAIHKALTQSLIDLALGVPIAHQNKDFDPADLDTFVDVSLLPASTEVISKDSLDEEKGIYQLSVYTKSNTNISTIYALADTIEANYRHGLELTSGTQKIFIDRTSRAGGRNSDGWFIIDLSINYIADLLR